MKLVQLGPHCTGPKHLDMFKLVQLGPHYSGIPTCSDLFNLDLTEQSPYVAWILSGVSTFATATSLSFFFVKNSNQCNRRRTHSFTATFEVSLFKVDEFVKFDEKLPVYTKWMDGKYHRYPTHEYHNSPVLSFYIDVYFSFNYLITGRLQLPVLHCI